uniref:Uncharacterized protein n=1 Tax=Oryza barthii TaxID=65489 RepID=A0A0D3H7V1_9ORYZ
MANAAVPLAAADFEQVDQFACGGFSLTVAMNHLLAGGESRGREGATVGMEGMAAREAGEN